MSVHRSLLSKSRLKRHRNVLTRAERVARLQEEEKFQEGDSVFGLPKVKTVRPKRAPKAKKAEKPAEIEVEAGAEATAEAAPEATATEAEAGEKK